MSFLDTRAEETVEQGCKGLRSPGSFCRAAIAAFARKLAELEGDEEAEKAGAQLLRKYADRVRQKRFKPGLGALR